MKKTQHLRIQFILGMALLSPFVGLKAQFDAMFTQYMFNESFINPAYAGSKEAMSLTLLHRQQWVGFNGRPVTTTFSFHGPVMDGKMGAGINVLTEQIGFLNRSLVYGSYAYRTQLSLQSHLAFGLMLGAENQLYSFKTLTLSPDEIHYANDPNYNSTGNNLTSMNVGTGVYYNTPDFYAGLSIPRIIDNQAAYSLKTYKRYVVSRVQFSKMTLNLAMGKVFRVNEELLFKANTLLKMVSNAPVQVDFGVNALIREQLWAGVSYRSKSSISALLGVQVNPQFLVNYAYDFTTNTIKDYSSGSHEIALNYLFAYKGKKIINPRYF